MPTSHNMIIYALAAGGQASIGGLILAGLLPAILLSVCNLGAAYYVAIKRGYPALPRPATEVIWRSDRRGRARAAGDGRHPGRHRLGIFTATESAAVAVIYSIILTFFLYRTMTWDLFMESAAKAAKTTGVVLLLIGVSTMFGYLMGLYSVADLAGEAMAGISTNPWVIFFLINLILFILGTFMDMASTILICTPIFLPIAAAYGMDPIQFGMVMLINCALGTQHAARGHHAVHRLRHRRGHRGRGDALDPAVLHGPAGGTVPGHLRAGVQPHLAAAVPAMSKSARHATVTDLETRAREALPC
jgi:tripartite ATP-independent transporter DctM subunit